MQSNRKIQNFFKIPSNLCPDFHFNGMKRTGILIATAFVFAFSSQAQIRDSLSTQNSKTVRIAGIALPDVSLPAKKRLVRKTKKFRHLSCPDMTMEI
jgi:hypothetical protein